MECLYCIYNFPLVGEMIIVANDIGDSLFYTEFVGRIKIEQHWKKVKPEEVEIIKKAIQQLNEFFLGERKNFDLKLAYIKASEFEKKVWEGLKKIPFGVTISYKDLAKSIFGEKEEKHLPVRAVGTANGKNPFAIVIPCHRVVTSDGKLGGYSGGIENKRKLLHFEARQRLDSVAKKRKLNTVE